MNHQLGFNNPAVDEAIRSHTTGLPDMSIESKILFVADFIEPGRDFHFRDKLESVAFNDINKAVALIALLNIHKLTKLCKEIHPNSVLCWNHYCHYVMSEDLKALGDPIV